MNGENKLLQILSILAAFISLYVLLKGMDTAEPTANNVPSKTGSSSKGLALGVHTVVRCGTAPCNLRAKSIQVSTNPIPQASCFVAPVKTSGATSARNAPLKTPAAITCQALCGGGSCHVTTGQQGIGKNAVVAGTTVGCL
jgi:hypothetical protein